MEHVLKDPKNNPKHDEYMKAAFGPKYDLDQIRANVAKMKGDDATIDIGSRLSKFNGGIASTVLDLDSADKVTIDPVTGKGKSVALEFGDQWFDEPMTKHDDADLLLHEAVHYFGAGSDHIVKPNVPGNTVGDNTKHQVYQDHLHQDLDIGKPHEKDDVKAKQNMIQGGGCT